MSLAEVLESSKAAHDFSSKQQLTIAALAAEVAGALYVYRANVPMVTIADVARVGFTLIGGALVSHWDEAMPIVGRLHHNFTGPGALS